MAAGATAAAAAAADPTAAGNGTISAQPQHGFPLLALTAAAAASAAMLLLLLWRRQVQHRQPSHMRTYVAGSNSAARVPQNGGISGDASADEHSGTPSDGSLDRRPQASSSPSAANAACMQDAHVHSTSSTLDTNGRRISFTSSWTHAALLVALLLALLLLAQRLAAGGPVGRLRGGGAAAVAANAATAAAAMHVMLARLPRCFTVGALHAIERVSSLLVVRIGGAWAAPLLWRRPCMSCWCGCHAASPLVRCCPPAKHSLLASGEAMVVT